MQMWIFIQYERFQFRLPLNIIIPSNAPDIWLIALCNEFGLYTVIAEKNSTVYY